MAGVVFVGADRAHDVRRAAAARCARRRARGRRGDRTTTASVPAAARRPRADTVSIPDVVMRSAADSTNSLGGRVITITGFTLKYPEGTDLGRVVIVCCAADAQLARIHLSGPAVAEAASYPEDTWLQVEGTVIPGTSAASTNFIPTIAVSSVTRIDKPANTYAY